MRLELRLAGGEYSKLGGWKLGREEAREEEAAGEDDTGQEPEPAEGGETAEVTGAARSFRAWR